jgi:hypothetical protein
MLNKSMKPLKVFTSILTNKTCSNNISKAKDNQICNKCITKVVVWIK